MQTVPCSQPVVQPPPMPMDTAGNVCVPVCGKNCVRNSAPQPRFRTATSDANASMELPNLPPVPLGAS